MAKHVITLYAYTFPSRAERVIWMLNELELEYEVIRLDPFKGETLTDEFESMAPMRKVPVLKCDEKVLTESLAIMEFLHYLKPEKELVPDTAEQIYEFRNLIYYMLTELDSYLWLAHQSTVLKAVHSWPEGTHEEALRFVERNVKHLFDKVGDNKFLLANKFTMADILAHHLLVWSGQCGIVLPDNVNRYIKELESRPTYSKI